MEKNITALFEINVPKTAKALTKFVGKETFREHFMYVCIEPGRGFMTATDTRKLRVINIEATGEWPEGARILVDPKHIAKIAGKTATVTVSEINTAKCVEIEADGENYVTEYKRMNYPDVMRVIPPKENRPAIRLTPESVEALKTICKLSKGCYVTLSVTEGDNRLIVCDEVDDYSENRASYSIALAAPAELTATISFSPDLLPHCLTGCNGTVLVDEPCKPIMFEGEADATLLMPMRVKDKDTENIAKVRDNSILVGSAFAEDAKAVAAQLRNEAAGLWQSILNFHKHDDGSTHFTPGNYSAKDVCNPHKAKCGFYVMPETHNGNLEVKCGNISLTVNYSELFYILSFWESATRSKKSVFAVGQVEEVTATVLDATDEGAAEKKMDIDGTIRAKVLQYKNDGNTLTEKWHTLTKFAEGIYFSYTEPDRYGHRSVNIIFSKNGIFWRIGGEPEHYFNPESFCYLENMETLKKRYANYEADILQAAANGGWLNKLHITVMERLGHDVAPLLAAYEERKRKWEENERKRIEAAEKAEQRLKEAEDRRKAELLADGKKKLLAGERITVEEVELIAESVGYTIHGRTLGFMREKVSEVALLADNRVNVRGYKLTHRNLSGTADVLREIATRIKAQAEQEAQQPATPAEMPHNPRARPQWHNVSAAAANAVRGQINAYW